MKTQDIDIMGWFNSGYSALILFESLNQLIDPCGVLRDKVPDRGCADQLLDVFTFAGIIF